MKQYLSNLRSYMLLAMLTMFSVLLTGCKDSNDEGGDQPTPSDKETYTIITIMQPGGNDIWTIKDMAEMIALREDGKITDNVNVVGIVKPSPNVHESSGYDYCVKFSLKPKQNLSEATVKELHGIELMDYVTTKSVVDEYTGEVTQEQELDSIKIGKVYKDLVFANLETSKFCSAETSINNAATITELIEEAVAEHPAKHYIFMPYGHGAGYDPTTDVTTRACLPDVNLNGEQLILDEFIKGIKDSGVKFDALLTQCCLMATLENMTAYAQLFDYYLGSDEVTIGGYFPHFIANFSDVNGDDTKLQAAFKDVVDFYAKAASENPLTQGTQTSFGYYDLRKMPMLLSTVKKATDWFIDVNKKDSLYMRDIILGTYYTSESRNSGFMDTTPDSLNICRDILLHPEQFIDVTDLDYLQNELSTILEKVYQSNSASLEQDYVFASMLKAAVELKGNANAGVDVNTIETIYNEYITNLKDMAYISGTKSAENDFYTYASPSVQLVNFNPDHYIALPSAANPEFSAEDYAALLCQYLKEKAFDDYKEVISYLYRGNFYATEYFNALNQGNEQVAKKYSQETISSTYSSTLFHQSTGWGTLLQQTTYNPSVLFNPYRK